MNKINFEERSSSLIKYSRLGLFTWTLCTAALCSAQDSPPVKILSWNIFMLPRVASKSSAVKRARSISSALDSSKYDVIVFQEAFARRPRKIIKNALNKQYPFSAGPANQKMLSYRTNSGIWILSRFPINSSHSIVYAACGGTDAFSRKGALLAEIQVGKDKFQIVGTHLQSAGGADRRISQCAQLYKELLLPFRNDSIPQVICGDLNINKYSSYSVYEKMLHHLDAADGILDKKQIFSFDPSHNDLLMDSTRNSKLIDYILVGNNGKGASFTKYNVKAIRYPWAAHHADLSDHFALEADVMLHSGVKPDPAAAQPDTLLYSSVPEEVHDNSKSGVVFSASYQYLSNGSAASPGIGLGVSRQVNKNLTFGIAAVRTFRDGTISNSSVTKLSTHLAGIAFDYSFLNHRYFSVSAPLMIGVGYISILSGNVVRNPSGPASISAEKNTTDRGTFLRPGVDFHFHAGNVFSVVAGAKAILFLDSDTIPNSFAKQFKNFTLSAGVNVRLFSHRQKS